MTNLIVKIMVIGAGMAAVAIFRFQAQRRAAALEASGGCLSCGSGQVVSEAAIKRCLACGYEGPEAGLRAAETSRRSGGLGGSS